MANITRGGRPISSADRQKFREFFGLVTPGYTFHGGKTAADLQGALNYLATLSGDATLVADGGETYTFNSGLVIDASRVSINWNGSTLNFAGLPAGSIAFSILSDNDTDGRKYSRNNYMENFLIEGGPAARDFDATAFYISADTPTASCRFNIRHGSIRNFKYGVRLKNRAYFSTFDNVEIYRCGITVQQDSGAVDFAECVSFKKCRFYNSDCLIRDLGGQRMKFDACSFDFHGDATGNRITADDRLFDLRYGAQVELHGCHLEWAYGNHPGQVNHPISLIGANTRFVMFGGKMYNANNKNPFYPATFKSDNASQWILLEGVHFVGLGRIGAPEHNDVLVDGSNLNNAGIIGRVVVRNAIPNIVDKNDFPSTLALTWGASLLRQGVEDPFSELSPRISVTGTATAVSANSPDGGISARSSASHKMIKITGQGKVYISFPIVEPLIRHAWSMFIEASQAAGNVTVRERHSTFVTKWNGSTQVVANDTRAAYSGLTHAITGGGVGWKRVSWKDVSTNSGISPRMNNDVFAIEIDTAGMTSGAIYISDFGYGLM